MLNENLDKLIGEAMRSRNNIATSVLRTIKSAILVWKTSKENVGKTLTEADEVSILRKIQTQYKDTATLCNDGKHDELVREALLQAEYIEQFLPEDVTEEAIRKSIEDSGIAFEKKNMGVLIKHVKAQYPTADGKLVADVVKTYL